MERLPQRRSRPQRPARWDDYFGYRPTSTLSSQFGGLVFVALFATSPLFLLYFSAILPDDLAIASSIVATSLLVQQNKSWKTAGAAAFLLAIASAVKSPLPFIFVVFSASVVLLSAIRSKEPGSNERAWKDLVALAVFLIGLLTMALAIEAYRGWLMSEMVLLY